MSYILLLIKAETYHQVKAAARNRGIYVPDNSILKENSAQFESNTFRALTDQKNLPQIRNWFNERTQVIRRYGYPPGTLLFFKENSPQ